MGTSREAILDAAEAVFAQRGLGGATVSDICAAANVSRGLPNYLFGSKEQLYREVVERSAVRLREAVTEPLLTSPPKSLRDAVRRFIDSYVDYLARNAAIVRLLQWELLSDPASPRPFAPASRLFGEIYEIFAVATARERAKIDVRTLLASTVSLCFFPFVMGTRVPVQMLYDGSQASAEELKRHVTRLITASLEGKR